MRRDRPFSDPHLQSIERSERPILLVTAHRRESWGEPMRRVAEALVEISWRLPELHIVLPAHRNPVVREMLLPVLKRGRNILVLEPLPYPDFTRLLSISTIVVTDSGGVQEEAPSLGKPVLVMRALDGAARGRRGRHRPTGGDVSDGDRGRGGVADPG